MKKGKRVKPVFPIEYRLLITPKYKEREKRFVTYTAIRTINEFSNFRYEIIVDSVLKGRVLQFNIHGLRAPQVTIPHSGPAVFESEFFDLHGTYEIAISKLDREENRFIVSISDKDVIVQKTPQKRFIDIVTTKEEF